MKWSGGQWRRGRSHRTCCRCGSSGGRDGRRPVPGKRFQAGARQALSSRDERLAGCQAGINAQVVAQDHKITGCAARDAAGRWTFRRGHCPRWGRISLRARPGRVTRDCHARLPFLPELEREPLPFLPESGFARWESRGSRERDRLPFLPVLELWMRGWRVAWRQEWAVAERQEWEEAGRRDLKGEVGSCGIRGGRLPRWGGSRGRDRMGRRIARA